MTLTVLRLPLLVLADFVPENGSKRRRFWPHSTNRFVSSHEPLCLIPRARLSHPTNRLAPAHEPVCLVPRTDLSRSTNPPASFHEPAGGFGGSDSRHGAPLGPVPAAVCRRRGAGLPHRTNGSGGARPALRPLARRRLSRFTNRFAVRRPATAFLAASR